MRCSTSVCISLDSNVNRRISPRANAAKTAAGRTVSAWEANLGTYVGVSAEAAVVGVVARRIHVRKKRDTRAQAWITRRLMVLFLIDDTTMPQVLTFFYAHGTVPNRRYNYASGFDIFLCTWYYS